MKEMPKPARQPNIVMMVALSRAGLLGGRPRIVLDAPVPRQLTGRERYAELAAKIPDQPVPEADHLRIEAALAKRQRRAARRA